jgi:hypothetical protein
MMERRIDFQSSDSFGFGNNSRQKEKEFARKFTLIQKVKSKIIPARGNATVAINRNEIAPRTLLKYLSIDSDIRNSERSAQIPVVSNPKLRFLVVEFPNQNAYVAAITEKRI